jgi:shikimate kinase
MVILVNNSREMRNRGPYRLYGARKILLGRARGRGTAFTFLDTDEVITTRAGKSVARRFSPRKAKPHCRERERLLVEELAERDKNGLRHWRRTAGESRKLSRAVKKHALIVCLWASPEKIWERVRHQSHRPLLQDPDPQARIKSLLEARKPVYQQADILMNTEVRSCREVAQQVIHQFAQPVRANEGRPSGNARSDSVSTTADSPVPNHPPAPENTAAGLIPANMAKWDTSNATQTNVRIRNWFFPALKA